MKILHYHMEVRVSVIPGPAERSQTAVPMEQQRQRGEMPATLQFINMNVKHISSENGKLSKSLDGSRKVRSAESVKFVMRSRQR